LEAQALGRPLITSNFGAMAEAAGSGAILVDPFDVRSIREAVRAVMNSADIRGRIIEQGLSNVDRFRPEAVANTYIKIYEDVSKRR
jgi:glycosyltransferase involved in cell wall biosynthesis